MKWNFLYQITAASRTPDYGATPPDPHSLCSLSSTEFVEPPPPKKNFLGTPLDEASWVGSSLLFHLRTDKEFKKCQFMFRIPNEVQSPEIQ